MTYKDFCAILTYQGKPFVPNAFQEKMRSGSTCFNSRRSGKNTRSFDAFTS